MKFQTFVLALVLATTPAAPAAKPKPAEAKPAAVARPTGESSASKNKKLLISTDMSGRDIDFVRSALDLEKTTTYLASEAARMEDKDLHGLCVEYVRALEAHGTVLATLAEMQSITVPVASARQKQIEDRISKIDSAEREAALLQAFIETDTATIAAYGLAAKSSNPTIRSLSEKALPQAKEHLLLMQTIAGRNATLPAVGEGPKSDEPTKPTTRSSLRAGTPDSKNR